MLWSVAAQLMRQEHSCPRLVRVYGERVEASAFPLPRSPHPPGPPGSLTVPPAMGGIALHNLVRRHANPASSKITEFDSIFALYPNDITDTQVTFTYPYLALFCRYSTFCRFHKYIFRLSYFFRSDLVFTGNQNGVL